MVRRCWCWRLCRSSRWRRRGWRRRREGHHWLRGCRRCVRSRIVLLLRRRRLVHRLLRIVVLLLRLRRRQARLWCVGEWRGSRWLLGSRSRCCCCRLREVAGPRRLGRLDLQLRLLLLLRFHSSFLFVIAEVLLVRGQFLVVHVGCVAALADQFRGFDQHRMPGCQSEHAMRRK